VALGRAANVRIVLHCFLLCVFHMQVKSLVCVDDVMQTQPNCFELLGYDVLIDANLKPWLIEVNSSPSLGTDSAFDEATKTQLVADTIALVDPLPFDHAALNRVLEARLGQQLQACDAPAAKAAALAAPPGSRAVATVGVEQERLRLESELDAVLLGRVPRAVGEVPVSLGHYERICPGSSAYVRAMNLKFAHFRAARSGASASIGIAGGALTSGQQSGGLQAPSPAAPSRRVSASPAALLSTSNRRLPSAPTSATASGPSGRPPVPGPISGASTRGTRTR
jgi:hypothetical protein